MGYSPTLGRWLEEDKDGYVDGANLYQMELSNPVNLLDPMGSQATRPTTQPAAPDQGAWDKQKQRAQDALNFWKNFLNLRMGNNPNGGPITDDCMQKLLDMIRAISYVESRHGTGTGRHPDRDPMQVGNPDDPWQKGLQGGGTDRIIGGPNRGQWNLGGMPGASGKPAPPPGGHDDPSYTPDMSYIWGVLAYIHKTNTGPNGGGRTYRCGECSWDQLIDGAVRYNGNPNVDYEKRIRDALKMIGSGPQS
jgi:hypothetical protein